VYYFPIWPNSPAGNKEDRVKETEVFLYLVVPWSFRSLRRISTRIRKKEKERKRKKNGKEENRNNNNPTFFLLSSLFSLLSTLLFFFLALLLVHLFVSLCLSAF